MKDALAGRVDGFAACIAYVLQLTTCESTSLGDHVEAEQEIEIDPHFTDSRSLL